MFSCRSKNPPKIPNNRFVNALLLRDTLTLSEYLDTLSIKYIEYYSIPEIKEVKKIHYRLIVSLLPFKEDTPLYKYTVIFPWNETFSFSLIQYGGKWQFPMSYYLNKSFSSISKGDIVYFYPVDTPYDNINLQYVRLNRFKRNLCSGCKNCCSKILIYVYTPFISPKVLYDGYRSKKDYSVYTNGLCISKSAFDTLPLMHALLDRNKYLYPFVEGVYNFYYGRHESFGIDYGDWIKSEVLTGSFKSLGKNIIENIVFYKPMSGPLGYMLVDYLTNKKGLKKDEIFNRFFSLSPDEEKIIKNRGDMEVFFKRHLGKFMSTSLDSVFATIGRFMFNNYRDLKYIRDTIRVLRDKKRNLTYVISSLYDNGEDVSQRFSSWVDSIDFFYKPYYTFLLVPLWLADSFRRVLTPANSYWVPAYEFKTEDEVIEELKEEYSRTLVSDYIRTYSIQEKQLPLWFSLGVPRFLSCGDSCTVNLERILSSEKGSALTFYTDPTGKVLPQSAIELSYLIVRLTNRLHRGSVVKLMERSISNIDFSKTYKEVTGEDIRRLILAWSTLVKDSLYFSVSIK